MIHSIECLRSSYYLHNMKMVSFNINVRIEQLHKVTEQKENRITDLEKRAVSLELQNDRLEQYNKKANMRFEGIAKAICAQELDK